MKLRSPYGQSILLLFFLFAISCGQKKEDAKNKAEQKNKELFNDPQEIKEAHFLVTSTEIELQQIKLAKLASENSINPEIKKIAADFLNIHIKQLYEVRNIAAKKGIILPTEITKKEEEYYNKMSYEIADDFDRLFIEENIKNYKTMISDFEKVPENADNDIKLWALKSLSVLRKNYGIIIVMQAEQKTKTNK